MLSSLRSRVLQSSSSSQPWKLGFNRLISSSSPSSSSNESLGYLELQEVEKILNDVKADDIKVIPVKDQCDWTDFMVIATGRSTWHVRNIAEALIYQVKQKQKKERGSENLQLPSVQGQEGGKWIVIDSGKVIIHALDEKAREYYDLEGLYTKEAHAKRVPDQDMGGAFVKVRPINNSKKKPVRRTS